MTCHRCAQHAGVAIQRVRHGRVEVVCEPCAYPPPDPAIIARGWYEGRPAVIREVGAELVLSARVVGLVQSVVVTPATRGAGLATLGLWFDGGGS